MEALTGVSARPTSVDMLGFGATGTPSAPNCRIRFNDLPLRMLRADGHQ